MLQDMMHLEQRTLKILVHMDTSALASLSGALPVQLVDDAAELFCNAVRMRMLGRHWPAPAILQLYTLACCVHQVKGCCCC